MWFKTAMSCTLDLMFKQMITTQDIVKAQKIWADAIVKIGKIYLENGDYETETHHIIDTL